MDCAPAGIKFEFRVSEIVAAIPALVFTRKLWRRSALQPPVQIKTREAPD